MASYTLALKPQLLSDVVSVSYCLLTRLDEFCNRNEMRCIVVSRASRPQDDSLSVQRRPFWHLIYSTVSVPAERRFYAKSFVRRVREATTQPSTVLRKGDQA